MFYIVNNDLNDLYVLSDKAVGPGKKLKLINVGPTFIPEARVTLTDLCGDCNSVVMLSVIPDYRK